MKNSTPLDQPTLKNGLDVAAIRADFPILHQKIHRQRDLIYFDNGASTQHPTAVIEAMNRHYRESYANVHRGIHWLSEQSSALFENARLAAQQFLNAPHSHEVIFTGGTTAGINTVAYSWGSANIREGDEILLSVFEHHSNIVPWQQLASRTGAIVRFAGITPEGELDLVDFQSKLNDRTKLVAIAAVSNVLGNKTSVEEVIELAKSVGAITLVDAAQHVPHEPTDVQGWGADFVVFSGHKMLAPSGVGILWGRESLLEKMPPFLGGGGMIQRVTEEGFTAGELPAKFEAGTPPIVEATGLAVAMEYLSQFDLRQIAQHEVELANLAVERIQNLPGLKVLGPSHRSTGIVGFVVGGIAAQDIAIMLDRKGIAIRAGHHCAMPLHDRLGVSASCRASFYLYNTQQEVEIFAEELAHALKRLRG